MAGPSQIVAVVAAGGALGFLIWKMRSPAAPAPQTDACAGLTGEALLACQAAGLLGGVIGVVQNNLKNDSQHFDDERNRRIATNDALNGPSDPSLSGDVTAGSYGAIATSWSDVNPTPAPPYRYANGCEPYFGAPGWMKCKPGTLDLYEMAVEQAAGTNAKLYDEARARVRTVFETPADLAAATANNQKAHDENDSHWYQVSLGAAFSPTPVEKLNKNNYGTGASGDPLTQGPWVDDGGQIWWLVRGKRFTAPAGQVPLAIAMRARGPRVAGQTQADVDAAIKALTDAQAVSLIGVGTYGAGSGTGTTVTYTGCAAIIADPTLTWTGQGWARLREGQKRNLGPCASHSSSSAPVSHATDAANGVGDHFGLSIGAP